MQCSSIAEQQAHNLTGVGAIPTTATKPESRNGLSASVSKTESLGSNPSSGVGCSPTKSGSVP